MNEIKIDITFEQRQEGARSLVDNALLFTGWVKGQFGELPPLRSLFYLLKKLLASNHLHIPYLGTRSTTP
jgi:hypothetical protein